MSERIDIVVPDQVLAANDAKAERLRKTHAFEPTDRTPVVADIQQMTALGARGRRFGRYVRSPRDNLREQILNHKWRIENVRDDQPIPTERLTLAPDLGCLRGVEFEMDIRWSDDQPPKCVHPLTAPEQIDDLEVPHPESGLNARRIEWYKAMRELAGDFDVRLNGRPLEIDVTLGHGGGPIPSAFALAGVNLMLWTALEPRRVHRLMRIVTDSHLNCICYTDELVGRDGDHAVWMGADSAEMLSPEAFREFALPYYLEIWSKHPRPRTFHMCGKVDHLLDILRDEMDIDHLAGFGFPTDRHLLAEKLAGRAILTGGPHPMLIKDGPGQRIVDECVDYIRTVGRRGGYILSGGCGSAVGTPVEHYRLMVEASKRAGPVPEA